MTLIRIFRDSRCRPALAAVAVLVILCAGATLAVAQFEWTPVEMAGGAR